MKIAVTYENEQVFQHFGHTPAFKIYTVEDGKINFTYYVSDAVAAPLDYSIEGETLNFMGAAFVRPDKVATADQQAPAAIPAQ